MMRWIDLTKGSVNRVFVMDVWFAMVLKEEKGGELTNLDDNMCLNHGCMQQNIWGKCECENGTARWIFFFPSEICN